MSLSNPAAVIVKRFYFHSHIPFTGITFSLGPIAAEGSSVRAHIAAPWVPQITCGIGQL